jgi:hypothetical protein
MRSKRKDYDKVTNSYHYRMADGQSDASPIGEKITSQTIKPVYVRVLDRRDHFIWDVPGIAENRGILFELVTNYVLHLIQS